MFPPVADVDVLMPIRNPNPLWLREALASVEAQRGVDARLVAVLHPDDQDLRNEISRLDMPTEIVFAPAMGNISDALNVGLAACSAPLIARLDADDVAEPTRLVRQWEEINKHPDCAVLASAVTLIDSSGKPLGIRTTPTTPDGIERRMKWKCAIAHPSVLFRRDVVTSLGGYNPTTECSEDYELWLRILMTHNIRAIPDPLVWYRIHKNQLTSGRPVSRPASQAVLQARLELAIARGDRTFAARARHGVWAARQGMRRLMWLRHRR